MHAMPQCGDGSRPHLGHSSGPISAKTYKEEKRLDCPGTRQDARERAALEQGFTGHAELAREAPFYEAMASVRVHLQKADEHLTVALSEVYIGAQLPPRCCSFNHGLR